jgi:hypothetical protein
VLGILFGKMRVGVRVRSTIMAKATVRFNFRIRVSVGLV